jgi:hypothetical protein
MTRSTREIERDVERTRSDIEHTVDALRDKMSIGQIVDEVAHHFRASGGNEMVSNLAAQARANPMPLALVGIGLAWLMSGRGQPAMGHSYYSSHDYGSDDTELGGSYRDASASRGIGTRAGEAASSAKDTVAQSVHKVGEGISSAKDTLVQSGHSAGEAVSSGIHQAGDRAAHVYGRMSDQASRTQRTVSDLVDREPLVLAGLGLAIGAAIGAMLPATETENRLLGEKRDSLKHRAEGLAREEWEKTKAVAKDAAAAAQREVEKGGSPADMAERAAKSATQAAERSAGDKGLGSSVRKTTS